MSTARIGFVLAGLAGLFACSNTELRDYPCPPSGTTLSYESFGQGFLAANCQTCHSKSGSERKGAPGGYDFHDRQAVLQFRERIFARAAADNTTMPPGPDDPPEAERYKLAEWLACGAP